MATHPYPIVARDLGANEDGTIFTNTGAIIHIRSLFCEALDLLRIQDEPKYKRMIDDLKARATSWTDPKDIYMRKADVKAGGHEFHFGWQGLSKNLSCNLEDTDYLLSEMQSKDYREINIVLHSRQMPESMLASMIGQSIKTILNIETYFAMIRGAVIKDAANLNNSVHFTLDVPVPKGK